MLLGACLLHLKMRRNVCRSSTFHTYIKIGDRSYKWMTDGGSCANTIGKSALGRVSIKVEPHRQPYNTIWVDKTTHFICLESTQFLVVFGVGL